MATQTQRRFLRADLNPTRTVCLERLERPAACHRTTLWRTSCGRPDPSSRRCLRGHDRMCPALWAKPRSRWSRCRHMCIQGLKEAAAPILTTRLRALRITQQSQIPMQPVAHSRTHIRFPVNLAAPIPCRPITRCRISCGSPNAVAGVACVAMAGCVRHCRGHDPHRGAVGQP